MSYNFNEMIERIKAKKKEAGLTNKQLSDISDVPFGTLNKILGSETKEPSINAIIKISVALGVSADYIINGTNEKSSFVSNDTDFSTDEIRHIKKYRTLDAHGKKAVSMILDVEFERCKSDLEFVQSNAQKQIKKTTVYNSELAIARSNNGSYMPAPTDEQYSSFEELTDDMLGE